MHPILAPPCIEPGRAEKALLRPGILKDVAGHVIGGSDPDIRQGDIDRTTRIVPVVTDGIKRRWIAEIIIGELQVTHGQAPAHIRTVGQQMTQQAQVLGKLRTFKRSGETAGTEIDRASLVMYLSRVDRAKYLPSWLDGTNPRMRCRSTPASSTTRPSCIPTG